MTLYLPSLVEIWRAASTQPYAGHVLFVPLLSGAILWSRRDQLRAGTARPHAALLLLGVGLTVAAVGHFLESPTGHAAAVCLGAAAVVVGVRGPEGLRRVAAPVALLLFLAPLPRAFVDLVTLDLQHLAATFADRALRLVGIPVHQEGSLLHLATVTLSVDRGCNGLRFLMVMLVATSAFACIYLTGTHRRVLLIALAVPAAILANCVRVTAIAVLASALGPDAVAGAPHDYAGRAVWLLAVASVLGLGVALCWDERRASRSPLAADQQVSTVISRA